MPSAPPPSNIRAFVRWKESSVYAGEEIECVITFKNVAPLPGRAGEQEEQDRHFSDGRPQHARRQSYIASVASSRRSSATQSVAPSTNAPSVIGAGAPSQPRGHRPALSLNAVGGSVRNGPYSASGVPRPKDATLQGHGRSLSIMSLGSDRAPQGPTHYPVSTAKRPPKMHGRSASLASVSSARHTSGTYSSPVVTRQPSPLYESETPPALAEGQTEQLPIRPMRRRPGTVSAGNTPQLGRQNSLQRNPPANAFDPSFQFPRAPAKSDATATPPTSSRPLRETPTTHAAQPRSTSPRPTGASFAALNSLHPISRVMSETASGDTPRTSSEFYSMSNRSDETITSDLPYPAHQLNGRLPRQDSLSRQPPPLQRPTTSAVPETLMMGYAQTAGHFILDGSLVNAAPFEEVKRRGVQGGGGVVGIDRAKHASGMFGAFRWGNLSESLGGLLGTDENSSIAQMKATAGSKSVPLLSTPQNLLFVDLRLAPSESKSFAYQFPLPRGLPPSHKGRVIKVTYHLIIGVQRPEGQMVKRIEVPFRVLGSYNTQGEILGHDLMSPYILLKDSASSRSLTNKPALGPQLSTRASNAASKSIPELGLEDFLRYTERLLEQAGDSGNPLASPSVITFDPTLLRSSSTADHTPATIQEAVDLAIVRANHVEPSGQRREMDSSSANRFNITRAGQPVAILTILRPSYRVGEAVIGTIDFDSPYASDETPSQLPTYSILAELESAERVDPSLALRSGNSIHRVTRKIHAAARENTLFSRRVGFSLTIPSNATPTFDTTGVSLNWRLRIEFATARRAQGLGLDVNVENSGKESAESELLEVLASDERGVTSIAQEHLDADTFEIGVPLRVYGIPGVDAAPRDGEALEV